MAFEASTNAAGVGTIAPVIVGLFNNSNDAHRAVTQLREAGFSSHQIGAAFRDAAATTTGTAATTAGTVEPAGENWWEKVKDAFRPEEEKVEGRRDTANESFVDADPDTRNDDYEYDFADNDFEGSLAGAGIPSDRAAYLTRSLRPGGAIVTVRDADRSAEAEEILSANHGKVQYEDATATDLAAPAYRDAEIAGIDAAPSAAREITDTGYADRRPEDRSASNVDRVQLFGEVLRVHKERISRGEVRVRKDVITENQTIEVPVTREELVLERVAVSPNTPASAASIGRDQEIRVPLSEETVRLEKQQVVREEVLVGKREVADVAKVSDDVRHEELRVDSNVEPTKRAVTGEDVVDDVRRHG